MMIMISNQKGNYNIPGLRQDYFSIQQLFYSARNKKERKELANWLRQIKQTLNELDEDIYEKEDKRDKDSDTKRSTH